MIFRVEKTKDYTVMSNYHLREKEMSLKAKGLLSWMLSNTDNWDYSIKGIVANCKENESAIKTTLKELNDFGYLEVKKYMPESCIDKEGNKQIVRSRIEYEYIIHEQPIQILDNKKQDIENLHIEFQCVENPIQINNKISNTKKRNTKDNSKELLLQNFSFGSKKESKKPNLYQQCISLNLEYFKDKKVTDKLKEYLDLWLQIGNKHFPNMWKGLLNKLKTFEEEGQDVLAIIEQSLVKGYTCFYPMAKYFNNKRKTDSDGNPLAPDGCSMGRVDERGKDDVYYNEVSEEERESSGLVF